MPTPSCTSTGSCHGWTSTTASCNWREDETLPLIERCKFLAIFTTNLDEFFMVRVAGVHDQVDARIDARGPDDLSPSDVLRADLRNRPRPGSPPGP